MKLKLMIMSLLMLCLTIPVTSQVGNESTIPIDQSELTPDDMGNATFDIYANVDDISDRLTYSVDYDNISSGLGLSDIEIRNALYTVLVDDPHRIYLTDQDDTNTPSQVSTDSKETKNLPARVLKPPVLSNQVEL